MTMQANAIDFEQEGFCWADCNDADQSVISYLRYAQDGSFSLIVLNFTPVPRENYRIGVPARGIYHEVFNSDSTYYGGGNVGNPQTNLFCCRTLVRISRFRDHHITAFRELF